MSNAASHASLPYPIRKARFTIPAVYAIFDPRSARLILQGESQSVIARDLGVSRSAILKINLGETWKHVAPSLGEGN